MLRRLFILGIFAALLLGSVLVGSAFWVKHYFGAAGPLQEEISIIITPGSSLTKIAQDLTEQGIIERPRIFTLVGRFIYPTESLQAGEYQFQPHISPAEVFNKMVKGDTVVHAFTVAEGLMASQILHMIMNIEGLEGTIDIEVKEGTLLPETYHYSRGDDRNALIKRMQQSMWEVLDALWEKRAEDLPIKNKEEAVILASIVEKETGIPEERGEVAAVFINRLNKGMMLQSDPTTIYGVTKGEYVLERPLSKRDLRTKTPYNTYTNYGLPPTPIANPGKEAIAAVLNPPVTDKLYFVANGEGGHQFSRTLKEHNRHVQKLRRLEREKRRVNAQSQ